MAKIEKTIFISYRRTDISWALAVYQYLTSQKYDVFFDYTSLSGGDFEQVITSNIRARAHFILILTPKALDRCNEPGDWLRREIETAVDEKRNIIPLFFDGFNFVSPSVVKMLTGKMKTINRYNGLDVPAGYFLEAMERLNDRYLNVPLDAILHPIPTEVRKAVKEEQVAADNALIQKRTDIEKLIKPDEEKVNGVKQEWSDQSNLRRYGIGAGILVVVLLGILGFSSQFRNFGGITTLPTLTSQPILPVAATPISPTPTQLHSISTRTPVPLTATSSPTPTLGIGSRIVSAKDGMTLLYVPKGEFTMGSEDGGFDEKPIRVVSLDSYWIDQTEVTQKMYSLCVAADVCNEPVKHRSFSRSSYYGIAEFDNYPVIYVDWNSAKAYCEWVDRRLPTEAEWEKAARGIDGRKYPWGNNPPNNNLLNFNQAVGDTTEVGKYPLGASPYDVLDMAGNVWEWVNDLYGSDYYDKSPTFNPPGPILGPYRVLRGGGWNYLDLDVRSTNRSRYEPTYTNYFIGFRCAMDAE